MQTRSIATVLLAGALALASSALSPAFAATKHAAKKKMSGACGQPSGRCISDCDAFNWCKVNTCSNGQSTPVPFWRCYEPSGLCFAPHC